MASDDKKVKTNPAPKAEAPQENKSTSEPSKAEGGDKAAASPTGYSNMLSRDRKGACSKYGPSAGFLPKKAISTPLLRGSLRCHLYFDGHVRVPG
jgi:hypothetical protein